MQTPAGATPGRVDSRFTLPPVRGGAVVAQACRALGTEEPGPSGVSSLPGAIRPRQLAPINLPQSPTALLPPPLTVTEIKGKGPSNGRALPKKGSPHASSEEDVTNEEGGGMARPAPVPPFRTTRPLPPLGGAPLSPIRGAALPPIGGTRVSPLQRQPSFPTRPTFPGSPNTLAGSMPSRRVAVDPFTIGPETSSSGPVPLSPTRRTPGPISPLRSPPVRIPPGRTPPTPLSPLKKPVAGVTPVHSPRSPTIPEEAATTAKPAETITARAGVTDHGEVSGHSDPPGNHQETTQDSQT